MNLENLYETGVEFKIFMELASVEEKNLINHLLETISLKNDTVDKFRNYNGKIKLLISAESWCPYARVTVSTLYKLSQLIDNLELKIITEGRGFIFLRGKLGIDEDDYVIPSIAILDEKGEYIDKYIGKPQKYTDKYFMDIRQDFFAGKYSDDILQEILEKLVEK